MRQPFARAIAGGHVFDRRTVLDLLRHALSSFRADYTLLRPGVQRRVPGSAVAGADHLDFSRHALALARHLRADPRRAAGRRAHSAGVADLPDSAPEGDAG